MIYVVGCLLAGLLFYVIVLVEGVQVLEMKGCVVRGLICSNG